MLQIRDGEKTFTLPEFPTADEVIHTAHQIIAARNQPGEALTDPTKAGHHIMALIGAEHREHFVVMFLDTRHRIIATETLFSGTIDGAEVHPREVIRSALAHNAAAVLIGHNHPSQVCEPSAADRAVTARLNEALKLVDVRLLDHFVVAQGTYVSMAARGWI